MVPSTHSTTIPATLVATDPTHHDPAPSISVCRWNTSSSNRDTAGGTFHLAVASDLVAPNGYSAQDGDTFRTGTNVPDPNGVDKTQVGVKETETGKACPGGLAKEKDVGTGNSQDACLGAGVEEEEGDGD